MTDSTRQQVVMPVWSPPLGEGPHPMERAEMMFIECTARREELTRITPSLCQPAATDRVKVFFANNTQPPNSLRFTEVGVIQEVEYEGRTIVWSRSCPSDIFYFLDTNHIKITYDPAVWFKKTEWKPKQETLDHVMQIICKWALTCDKREAQGVIANVNTA